MPIPHNPRLELTQLYEKILRFSASLPEDYVYRKTTESLVKERQKIVKEVNARLNFSTRARITRGIFERRFSFGIPSYRYNVYSMLQNENVADIEDKINQGQVGELVIQAKNELSLIEMLVQARPWENLMEKAPPHQWTWPPRK